MDAKQALTALAALMFLGVVGCASKAGNVALGAGAAGAAYEYSNDQQLEELEKERDAGKIPQGEYERRAQEIKDRSLIH